MRCTEAARCSGIRNRWQGRTHAGKPDKPDRTSGPEPVPPSKPSRSSKSPKPECASEPPSVDARGWRADRPKIERREVPENQKTAAKCHRQEPVFRFAVLPVPLTSKAADARRCLRSIGAGAARLPIGINPEGATRHALTPASAQKIQSKAPRLRDRSLQF